MVLDRLPSISLWCAHVTVTPDANSTAVFSKGTLNGSNVVIPTGGQQHPNSGVGESLLWKNAQKNARKAAWYSRKLQKECCDHRQ